MRAPPGGYAELVDGDAARRVELARRAARHANLRRELVLFFVFVFVFVFGFSWRRGVVASAAGAKQPAPWPAAQLGTPTSGFVLFCSYVLVNNLAR